jgi:hypothetical protein
MLLHKSIVLAKFAAIILLSSAPTVATATVTGFVEPVTSGQYMSLRMTINDTTTRFELTGPDYSFFAFGFNATTMQGYSLIIEGLDATRTAVEQNLVGIGNPGAPQTTQNISIVSTVHDAANDLTTIVLERPNQTGDANDPDFTTSMNSLPLIWAYNSNASPAFPDPNLAFHGFGIGRGFATIEFGPVPEPGGAALASTAAIAASFIRRRRNARM